MHNYPTALLQKILQRPILIPFTKGVAMGFAVGVAPFLPQAVVVLLSYMFLSASLEYLSAFKVVSSVMADFQHYGKNSNSITKLKRKRTTISH